jgi:asparagine synthase (glutamine-hydrolysing)
MCGICGIVDFNHHKVDESAVIKMRDVMINRGPDYGGIYINHHTGLGHRRLKIIDLSDNANQPMSNKDQTIWVVFNGEIYNFRELRNELIEKGHVFKSNSDTEVIVHGYEQWEEKLFTKLDGMFAIGLWDKHREVLILARDRFGKKPLYYMKCVSTVYFSSDIKSFWRINKSQLTIDYKALDCYLYHLSPTQDHCIFNEVSKVKPGHYRIFAKNYSKEVRYWSPCFKIRKDLRENEILEMMDYHLRKAIQKRLISDVPLGAFLSGGVDSSLIVAMMSQLSVKPCMTFSVGFDEQDYSELRYSRMVSERYKTDHHEIVLKPDVLEVLPSLIWEYGEPFADSSALPTYYVSKISKQFVTVALTGDGGDEMFGGYDIARAAYFSQFYNKYCSQVMKDCLENVIYKRINLSAKNKYLHKIKTVMVHANSDPNIRYCYTMGFSQELKGQLYTPRFKAALNEHDPYHVQGNFENEIQDLDLVNQYLFLDIVTRLPNDYLIKIDVASMMNSLEIRSPFLDHELSELSGSIDPLIKVKWGQQKYLLKKLAQRYLPSELIYRRKRGFGIPIKHWFKNELLGVLNQILIEGKIIEIGWFDKEYVKSLVQQHISGAADHTHRIWSLLWLEMWYRIFIEGSMKSTDSLRP